MSDAFAESVVEQAALVCLESTGWKVRYGAEVALGGAAASLVGRNV